MTYTAKYTNADHTSIERSDMPGASIPKAPGNRHYQQILADGAPIAPFVEGWEAVEFDPLVDGWKYTRNQ